jgi:hypothetical protein
LVIADPALRARFNRQIRAGRNRYLPVVAQGKDAFIRMAGKSNRILRT